MKIGQAAKASGLSVRVIRYYESEGVMPSVPRAGGNYRAYTETDVHTLTFIRRARALGFSIAQTRALLALWRDRSRASADVKAMALAQIAQFDAKIKTLAKLRASLQQLADSCHGDHRPECPILEGLSGGYARLTSQKDKSDCGHRTTAPNTPVSPQARAQRQGFA